jgi:hypothetical protein
VISARPAPVISAAPLGCLKALVTGSKLSDLGPLAGCVHLEELSTCCRGGCTDISDLSPLGGCAKLKRLSIVRSKVLDLAPLRGCVEICRT